MRWSHIYSAMYSRSGLGHMLVSRSVSLYWSRSGFVRRSRTGSVSGKDDK